MYSPPNKDILLFNLNIVIKFRKSTLIQYYYLIYRLYSTSPVVLVMSFRAKGKKIAFWSLICDVNCKYYFLLSLSFVFWFCLLWFSCYAKLFFFIIFMHVFICSNYLMVKWTFLGVHGPMSFSTCIDLCNHPHN